MKRSALDAACLVSLILLLAALPIVIPRGIGAYAEMRNDPVGWLPRDTSVSQDYRRFVNKFGSDRIVFVGWRSDSVTAETISEIQQAILNDPLTSGCVDRVVTAADLMELMTDPPANLTPEEATQRLKGILIGRLEDGSAFFYVVANQRGEELRETFLNRMRLIVESVTGLSPTAVHVVGPLADRAAADSECHKNLLLMAGLTVVVCLVIARYSLRSTVATLLAIGVAAFSGVSTAAMVGLTGQMNAVVMVIPALVFVVSASGSIHVVNYFHDNTVGIITADRGWACLKRSWLPCVLAAATTALGLGSLLVSSLSPIRSFGAFSALGVMLSLVLTLIIVPTCLGWQTRFRHKTRTEHRSRSPRTMSWAPLADFVSRHGSRILLSSLLLSVVAGIGISRMRASARVPDLFRPQTRILRDYTWFEQHLGPTAPLEVLLFLKADPAEPFKTRVQHLRMVSQSLTDLEEVGHVVTAATFVPEAPPAPTTVREGMQQRLFDQRLEKLKHRIADTPMLRFDEDSEVWRISLRVSVFSDVDAFELGERVRLRLEEVLAEETNSLSSANVVVTGITVVTAAIQRQLLDDLFHGFLLAFVLVSIMVTLGLRSVRLGLLAMLPNVFPALVVLGVISLYGQPLDVGTVVTASVALGIAVDDTVHFLNWYTRGLLDGLSTERAVGFAYERCAAAMVQTTFVCGLGLLPWTLSGFAPTARFSVIILAMLLIALLGDLLMLPALLNGRLGRWCCRSFMRPAQPNGSSAQQSMLEATRTGNETTAIASPGPCSDDSLPPGNQ